MKCCDVLTTEPNHDRRVFAAARGPSIPPDQVFIRPGFQTESSGTACAVVDERRVAESQRGAECPSTGLCLRPLCPPRFSFRPGRWRKAPSTDRRPPSSTCRDQRLDRCGGRSSVLPSGFDSRPFARFAGLVSEDGMSPPITRMVANRRVLVRLWRAVLPGATCRHPRWFVRRCSVSRAPASSPCLRELRENPSCAQPCLFIRRRPRDGCLLYHQLANYRYIMGDLAYENIYCLP